MNNDRPVIDDVQYARAIELATGLKFDGDTFYGTNGWAEQLVKLKAYHQQTDPYTITTRGLCHIFLMMRLQEIKSPGSTVGENTHLVNYNVIPLKDPD